jgi:hypothetical protein
MGADTLMLYIRMYFETYSHRDKLCAPIRQPQDGLFAYPFIQGPPFPPGRSFFLCASLYRLDLAMVQNQMEGI